MIAKYLAVWTVVAGLWLIGCSARQQPVNADPNISAKQIARYEQSQGRGITDEEGTVVTPTGLKYRVLHEGTGKTPGHTDKVTVHYTGWLEDGTVFDSSYQRGRPVTFEVDEVIPGWTQALKKMKEGDKWRVVVPPYLGYGARGKGSTIGPNATLYFEIELLKVQ